MGAVIRAASIADAAALAALKRRTFHETFVEGFAIPYPAADLALFDARHHSVEAVTAGLEEPQAKTWVVAEAGALHGYAAVGPCKLPHPEATPEHGELRQIYVSRTAQGRGFGHALLALAIEHLAARFAGPIWLGVWSGNIRAQALYRARGFEQAGSYRFAVGSWFDEELIFRLPSPR